MGNFRNQANLRAKVSRIGGGTIMLSILLIGLFSTQKNTTTSNAEVLLNPSIETTMSTAVSENVNEVEPLVEKNLESTASTVLSESTSAAPKSITAPMKTSSMVQYASMESMVADNKGKIIWKTSAQRHIRAFEIERSIDDDTYVSLGSIEAEGSGEHLDEELYEFIDEKLSLVQMPRVYYRIKQVGYDGVEEYSEVMEQDFGLDLGLYARIEEKSSGKINILYAADKTGPITMRLLNVGGQVVEDRNLEADFDPQLLAIDASDWKEGKYFLQLEDGSTSVMEQFQYKK